MYERAPITLPPPLPPMALRFTISAAYAICAFGIAPFILVGLLIRCLGVPLAAVIDRFSKPKSGRRPRGSAGRRDRAHQSAPAAPAPATPTVTAPSPRRQLSSASIYSTKSSSSSAASIRRAEGRAASEAVNGDELSPAQAYAAAARGTSAPPGAERKASSSSSLWRR